MSYKLEDVKGIGKTTAERLRVAKIDSVEKLAKAKVKDLLKLKIKGVGKATAEKYIADAVELVSDRIVEEQPPPSLKVSTKKKPVLEVNAGSLKELMKKQAECNIGLVGHVDHGIY